MTAFVEDTYVADLAYGFARLLGAAGIGFVWDEQAQYDTALDGAALYVADAPADDTVPLPPDRVCVVTPYPLTAEPQLSNSTWGVQFRHRGRREQGIGDVLAASTALRRYLLGFYPLTLPTGIKVSLLSFANGGSLGVDPQNRWEWQDSFTARTYEPSTHRH